MFYVFYVFPEKTRLPANLPLQPARSHRLFYRTGSVPSESKTTLNRVPSCATSLAHTCSPRRTASRSGALGTCARDRTRCRAAPQGGAAFYTKRARPCAGGGARCTSLHGTPHGCGLCRWACAVEAERADTNELEEVSITRACAVEAERFDAKEAAEFSITENSWGTAQLGVTWGGGHGVMRGAIVRELARVMQHDAMRCAKRPI